MWYKGTSTKSVGAAARSSVLEGSILTEGGQVSPPLCGTKEPVQKQLGQQPVAQSWLQRMCSDQTNFIPELEDEGSILTEGSQFSLPLYYVEQKNCLSKTTPLHPSTPFFFSFFKPFSSCFHGSEHAQGQPMF